MPTRTDPPDSVRRLPTVEDEIARLLAERTRISRRLQAALRRGRCQERELGRDLAALPRLTDRLTALIHRYATTNPVDELQRFLGEVAKRVREEAQETARAEDEARDRAALSAGTRNATDGTAGTRELRDGPARPPPIHSH